MSTTVPALEEGRVPSAETRRRRHSSHAPGEPRLVGFLYVLPALVAMSAILLVPLALTIGLSFMSWDGLGPRSWVGTQNFRDLARDETVRGALHNAAILTLFYSAIPITLGFITASLLARVRPRVRSSLRTLLFLPAVIAPVVVAVGWRLVYDPSNGVLNRLLGSLGLGGLQRAWLGDFSLALPATGVVATWMEYGLVMVLFLAGIQKIPVDQYDAARVDGANPLREFFAVTLPGLRNELAVAFLVTVIAAFRNFDLVYNLTRGGPGTATNVPVLEVFQRAFLYGQLGSGAALGVTIAGVMFLLAAITFTFTRRLRDQ